MTEQKFLEVIKRAKEKVDDCYEDYAILEQANSNLNWLSGFLEGVEEGLRTHNI